MKPDNSIIKGGVPTGSTARALVEPGKACALYLRRNKPGASIETLQLELPEGRWRAEWIDVLTGRKVKAESFKHNGGVRAIETPSYAEEVALRVVRR